MTIIRLPRWFLCVLAVSPVWYLALLSGADANARLKAVDRAILQARTDIRMLDTEFATRASVAQLERWNNETFTLVAPTSDQFVAETALASLDPHGPAAARPTVAVAWSDASRPLADRRQAPQVAMLDPASPGDAGFDGLRGGAYPEGRGLR